MSALSIKNVIKSKLFIASIISTFVIGLIAHGYCYFNLLYSHDSMLVIQNDSAFQISLGRFLIPVFVAIRGVIYAPALVGFLSLLFIAISVYLVCKLFSIHNIPSIVLVASLMTANCVVSLTNATFIHNADMYMFALLCAVLGVYSLRQHDLKFSIFATLFFLVCLGIYQCYLQVSSALLVLLAIFDILSGKDLKNTLSMFLKGILILFISLILYFIFEKCVMHFSGINGSDTYNGINSIGYTSGSSVLSSIVMTYKYVIAFFLKPIVAHSTFVSALNIILLVLYIWFVISIFIKKKLSFRNIIAVLILFAILPFAMNFCCFIAKGEEHNLMKYSFLLVYVFIIPLFGLYKESALWKNDFFCISLHLILLSNVFCSIIYSNQIYLYKSLNSKSTLSLMTRIVDRIEQTDGYISGTTSVAICGSPENTVSNSDLSLYIDTVSVGMESGLSVTYYDTYSYYINYILNRPIQLVDEKTASKLSQTPEVNQMPAFPSKDCTKIVNDILVIKLS